MAKTTRTMPAVQGVVPGSIATLDCPLGLTYHGIVFTLGGTTFDLSYIDNIRLKANGREIFSCIGSDLDVCNMFDGESGAATTQFYLDFERPNLDTAVGPTIAESLRGRELTAIGTGAPPTEANPIVLDTLQLEFDINSAAVAPTMSAKSLQSGPKPLGLLRKRRVFNYSVVGSGEFDISDLPRGDLIDKIYIFHGGTVTRVKLERDNFLSFDRTPDENTLFQINGVRVPQNNVFVIDPSERGRGDEAYITATIQDFRLKVETNAADTLKLYVDYLGSIAGN